MNILPLAKQAMVANFLLEGCGIRETERLTLVHRETITQIWRDLSKNYDNVDELRSVVRWYCSVGADGQTAAMRAGDAVKPWSMEMFIYAHRDLPRSLDPEAKKPSALAATQPAFLPPRCPMRMCYGPMTPDGQDGVYRCLICESELRPSAKGR